ncbi:hypothetical protein [Novosphingobium sp.]|uniref:hypothetical protein n=1 Tax=Novosphingobium sp. TaxID=1874826 RepID=UPI0031E48EB8
MKTFLIATNAAATVLPLPVFAQDAPPPTEPARPAETPRPPHISPIYMGITGGTLGVGPELSYAINRYVGLRGNITFLDISHSFDSGGLPYQGQAHLGSGGLMLDFRPFGGGFFISGGARLNRNKLRANSNFNGVVVVDGVTYTSSRTGTLMGYANFPSVAPTLTFGYAGTLRRGIKVGIEAGAMFMGAGRVYPFTATGMNVSESRLEAQRAGLQRVMDHYEVYPILQLTAGYRF